MWAPTRWRCCIDSRPVVDDVAVLDEPTPVDLAERVEITPADAKIGGTLLLDKGLMSHVVGLNEDVVPFEFEQRVAEDMQLAQTKRTLFLTLFQIGDKVIHPALVSAVVVGGIGRMTGAHQIRIEAIGR